MKASCKRMQVFAARQAFHGLHRAPVGPNRELAAGVHRLAIEQHRAGAALTAIAADLGARELQVIAQHFDQRPAILYLNAMFCSVDRYLDGRARDSLNWCKRSILARHSGTVVATTNPAPVVSTNARREILLIGPPGGIPLPIYYDLRRFSMILYERPPAQFVDGETGCGRFLFGERAAIHAAQQES